MEKKPHIGIHGIPTFDYVHTDNGNNTGAEPTNVEEPRSKPITGAELAELAEKKGITVTTSANGTHNLSIIDHLNDPYQTK